MRNSAVILLLGTLIWTSVSFAGDKVYTLHDAYESALASNETVKISEESVLQADSRVDQAWTYIYPKLTGHGSYVRYNETLPPNGGASLFQPLGQMQASVVLTQPIYTGGRAVAALRAAKKLQEASRNDLSTARQNILLGVAEAFYAVLRAQKSVDVGRDALARMENHRKVTQRESATRRSKANISALLRANTLVDQARISLVLAENGLKVARQKLSLLTQLPEDALLTDPPPLEALPETLPTLQQQALTGRDDYISSQMNEKVAEESVNITKGAHLPQVYAEGGVKYVDSSPATMMDATTYYGGIFLQVPIFEGGLEKAEVAEARSKKRQAELATALLRRTVMNDVAEAYLNYQTVNTVFETTKTQLEYARTNFETVEGLFAEGLVSSLSLIDAEQVLVQAEQGLVNATYDRQLAILQLRRSVGILMKDS